MRIVALFLILICATACQEPKTPAAIPVDKKIAPLNDSIISSGIIYEVNLRHFSPEGTLNAFTEHIPNLKKLGVKFIWLMPIHPISEKKRKGSLGSYYAVSDYKKVSPEYGTLQDFKKLVETAHRNDLYVLLDWVPNHTGWDHVWIQEHPEFYTQNEDGEILDPLNPDTGKSWGWTDVADLNYNNKQLRDSMIQQMLYWVKDLDVDGFRCDVAGEVPTDFWETAIDSLQAVKPVFMLAEAEKPELFNAGFQMQYGWEALQLINRMALGEKTVTDWDVYMTHLEEKTGNNGILMHFTSNHDENAWNGTVYERLNAGAETFAALTYLAPGMPLIFNGQEYDLKKRLAFFEKDTIPHTQGKMYGVYEKLGQLKTQHAALKAGKSGGSYRRITTSHDNQILAFERAASNEKVYFIGNLSADTLSVNLNLQGDFRDYMSDKTLQLTPGKSLKMTPWAYWILTPQ